MTDWEWRFVKRDLKETARFWGVLCIVAVAVLNVAIIIWVRIHGG